MTRGDFFMNVIEKRLVLWALVAFVMGFLFHYTFDILGRSPMAAIFFPTNESTWEHMKLIFWPMVLIGAVEFFAFRSGNPNLAPFLSGLIVATYAIPILFYTYTGIFGYHFFLGDIAVFIVAILAGFRIWYSLEMTGYDKNQPLLMIITLITGIMFAVFSYWAPKIPLFISPV